MRVFNINRRLYVRCTVSLFHFRWLINAHVLSQTLFGDTLPTPFYNLRYHTPNHRKLVTWFFLPCLDLNSVFMEWNVCDVHPELLYALYEFRISNPLGRGSFFFLFVFFLQFLRSIWNDTKGHPGYPYRLNYTIKIFSMAHDDARDAIQLRTENS